MKDFFAFNLKIKKALLYFCGLLLLTLLCSCDVFNNESPVAEEQPEAPTPDTVETSPADDVEFGTTSVADTVEEGYTLGRVTVKNNGPNVLSFTPKISATVVAIDEDKNVDKSIPAETKDFYFEQNYHNVREGDVIVNHRISYLEPDEERTYYFYLKTGSNSKITALKSAFVDPDAEIYTTVEQAEEAGEFHVGTKEEVGYKLNHDDEGERSSWTCSITNKTGRYLEEVTVLFGNKEKTEEPVKNAFSFTFKDIKPDATDEQTQEEWDTSGHPKEPLNKVYYRVKTENEEASVSAE